MTLKSISAEIITCPGDLGDLEYPALEIQLEAFKSPYVLRFTLPTIVYRALSEQMDPLLVFEAIADAVNSAATARSVGRCCSRPASSLIESDYANAAPQHV